LLSTDTVTPSDWDYVNRSTFHAPTGTSLFYYKDIEQEIVHTLLLEEYGVSKKCTIIVEMRQGLKCGFESSRSKWTFGSRLLLCQEYRRRREETAWERGKIQTSLVIVMFMKRMMTYALSNKLLGN
jgi:hypothetical protein